MLKKRVIPTLLLKGEGLYKTVKFKKSTYLGDAINVSKIFNEKLVDELIILDISATKENREPNYELIKDITSSCFMPVAYGGGVSTVEIAQKLFSIGVEKVCINSAANTKPQLIFELSEIFGNQSIVVALNFQKNWLGKYTIVNNDLKQIDTGEIINYVKKFEELGAGEILMYDVDNDGVMKGYDLKFMNLISSNLKIPVIACGGARDVSDIQGLFKNTNVSAAAAGSLFVYNGPRKAVLISYLEPHVLSQII